MVDKKEIVVDIDENGEIMAETFGFESADCEFALDKLMKGLANSKEIAKKPEYFRSKVNQNKKIKTGQK